jgi:acyl-CoA thioester hydrolase
MSELLSAYRKIGRFVVPFGDVDMMRHVNNVAYLRWAETSRTEYFAEVLGEDILSTRGMILAKMGIDYLKPLVYRERVAIGCRVSRLGTKSFEIEHHVVSEDRDVVAATIGSTLVAFDYQSDRTIEIPARWREAIDAFQNGSY